MRHGVALRRSVRITVSLLLTAAGAGCRAERSPAVADATGTGAVAPAALAPAAIQRAPAVRLAAAPVRVVTPADVLNWSGRGLSDDAILDQLDGAVCPTRVTTADQANLHDAGVSHDVIDALRAVGSN